MSRAEIAWRTGCAVSLVTRFASGQRMSRWPQQVAMNHLAMWRRTRACDRLRSSWFEWQAVVCNHSAARSARAWGL